MKLLLLRPLDSKDRLLFRRHKIFICPAFKIVRRAVEIPKKEFDYALVTSSQALRFLSIMPRAKQWIAIGKKTAASLRRPGVVALKDSNSSGVLKFFAKNKRGSILFCRSQLGDRALVAKLRALGYGVVVRHTYQTEILNIRSKVQKILARTKLDAIFVTSPSSWKAIRKSFSSQEIRSWAVKWVAIGPTTAQALNSFGIRAIKAQKPSLKSMLKCLRETRSYPSCP